MPWAVPPMPPMPWLSLPRQDDDLEPEPVQMLDGFHEAVQIDRLLDVAVGAGQVAGLDVPLVGRGGEDDDRDLLQGVVPIDRLQHLATCGSRAVQVEQEAPRPRRAR